MYTAADSSNVTFFSLLDLSATFHAVDHLIFIEWLQFTFGVRDHALNWLSSYLCGHTQFITMVLLPVLCLFPVASRTSLS